MPDWYLNRKKKLLFNILLVKTVELNCSFLKELYILGWLSTHLPLEYLPRV